MTRYRKSLIEERSRELNRLQKVLETANIKLSSVLTDANGKSLRRLLEKIAANEISARRGKNRAAVAVAHSILTVIYHILKERVPYRDLGSEYYDSSHREHKINGYLKRLQALGWTQDALGTA